VGGYNYTVAVAGKNLVLAITSPATTAVPTVSRWVRALGKAARAVRRRA
jgi:hypothetical protein